MLTLNEALEAVVQGHGGTVRRSLFDGGETVTVRLPNIENPAYHVERRFTHLWGDSESAYEQAARWVASYINQ